MKLCIDRLPVPFRQRAKSRFESPTLVTVSLARQIDSKLNLCNTVCLWLCKHRQIKASYHTVRVELLTEQQQ